jgi:glucose-6-phosphate isomerase
MLLDLDDPAAVRRVATGRSPALFSSKPTACAGAALVDRLIAIARETGAGALRVCLHTSPTDELHDMLVLASPAAYAAPHMHVHKDETYHLVRGSGLLVLFDAGGRVTSSCTLDAQGTFLARVGRGQLHTLVPLSDPMVFHESRPGPFDAAGDSVAAPWAPARDDEAAGLAWQRALVRDHGK